MFTILELTSKKAAERHLFSDFGLVNLPGCGVRTIAADDSRGLRDNLQSLTRYGWLMADLTQAEALATPSRQESDEELAAAAGVLNALNAELPVTTLTETLNAASREHAGNASLRDDPEPASPHALPPPI